MITINIRSGPVSALSTEELVTSVAFFGLMADRIHENGHEVPSDIQSQLRACEAELTQRLRADKEKQLAVAKARLESLLTQTEKRKKTEAEIAALEQELGYKKNTK
jgi:hypothetical protein